MISGTIGATSVYPLNVIRTRYIQVYMFICIKRGSSFNYRLQAQGTSGHPRIYKSPWEAVEVTFKSDGLRGFYKGLGPTLLKVKDILCGNNLTLIMVKQVVPAVSISYVTYEWSKRELGLS